VKKIPVDFLDDTARTITLIWNRNDIEEVEIARRRFTKHLEKGWIAFMTTPEGQKIQIHRFNPKLEKITLARIIEGG